MGVFVFHVSGSGKIFKKVFFSVCMVKEKKKEGKLKILAAGDIHGSKDIAERLARKAQREKVDLVILAGDIHGAFKDASEEVMRPFKKAHQKVVFVPGNWDSSEEVSILRNIHNIKNLDGYYVNYHGVDIVGIGNKDFELNLDEKKAKKKLDRAFERIKTKSGRKILVSHIHAADTKAEFSGFKGSRAVRDAIEKFKPDIFIQGHIHEAEGIEEKIGNTKVINVGRGGKVIEI